MMTPDNPMQSAHNSPRCTAKSKRTGKPCRGPAVRGYTVCRMHGAKGGAPCGELNGNYRHGESTNAATENMRSVRRLIANANELLKNLEKPFSEDRECR